MSVQDTQVPEEGDQRQLRQLGKFDHSGATEAAPADEVEYGVVQYFDVDIRVVLDPLSMELTLEEFMDVAAGLEGSDDPRAFGVVRAFLRAMIHPEDFNKFWRLVRTNRQDTVRQMEFGKWLIEEVTGHPFAPQSGSAAMPSSTQQNSVAAASLRAQQELEAAGRPDLALVVVRAREAAGSGS